MSIKPIHSDHSGEWHRERFVEFAAAKTAVGEPTPHMRVLEYMCRGASGSERLWRAGCYAATYSLLSAEAIWREWPVERMRVEGHASLESWLRENWPGIHTRKPRRMVRSPERMADCLLGYFDWMHAGRTIGAEPGTREEYDAWWAQAGRVPYFGRYIIIRLLELYRRWGVMDAPLYDIRAIGAHSPIRCLMLLYPAAVEQLATGDPMYVNELAEEALRVVRDDRVPELTPFAFAALLCEYRAAYEDRRDYPGNQTDEELAYLNSKYMRHWIECGYATGIWTARQQTTHMRYLGEAQGWDGIRPIPARSLRDFGLVWDDRVYDYAASVDAGYPVLGLSLAAALA